MADDDFVNRSPRAGVFREKGVYEGLKAWRQIAVDFGFVERIYRILNNNYSSTTGHIDLLLMTLLWPKGRNKLLVEKQLRFNFRELMPAKIFKIVFFEPNFSFD